MKIMRELTKFSFRRVLRPSNPQCAKFSLPPTVTSTSVSDFPNLLVLPMSKILPKQLQY